MDRTGRLALVPPRFGDEVVGGAEAVVRDAARGLAERGWDVEVLTTCARDHYTWANEYPEGVGTDGLVTVRRFATVVDSRAERLAIHASILAGEDIDLNHQQRWINGDVRSPGLYHWLLDHAEDYRALVFAPYLFWPTFAGAQVAPERTILMPCLHDEPEAWLELFQPVFTGVRGIWFLADPERDLARRIHGTLPDHRVIGAGVHVPDSYDPDGFRKRHGIEDRFVYYSGRREGAKNWEWLLEAFARAVERHGLPFSLVTTGTGEVRPPDEITGRVVDLGMLPIDELPNVYAAADAYLQPSRLESFSISVLDAWLAGTLVIANAASDVVRWHCERSGAGLLFEDDVELGWCLRFVADEPDNRIAAAGRDYVLRNYRWPDVLDRMEATIDEWLPA